MTGKQMIMILLGLLIIFVIYLIFSKKSKPKSDSSFTNSGGGSPTDNSSIISTLTSVVSGSFPLKKGSVGSNVVTLQKWLNSKGASLTEDGAFGNLTLAALQKYTGLSEVSETYFKDNIVNSPSLPNFNPIGKTVYAAFSGAQVRRTDFKTYDQIYKTASKGEWMGVVSGIDNDRKIYLLGSDFYTPISSVKF